MQRPPQLQCTKRAVFRMSFEHMRLNGQSNADANREAHFVADRVYHSGFDTRTMDE
jgi:hypothetical protein